jgi:hypothetical protein
MVQAIAQASSNVLTIAAAQAGDLIITGHRWASNTPPTPPSGYTDIGTHQFPSTGPSMDLSYFIAAGGETSITHPAGTTDRASAIVYRGARIAQALQASTKANNSGTTINFNSLTPRDPGRSWMVGYGGTSGGNTPSGETGTQRSGFASGSLLTIMDSNGPAPASAWSGQTITLSANLAWAGWLLEIVSL